MMGEGAQGYERQPAVAGLFYPGEAGALRAAVGGHLACEAPAARPALAVIGPHAGLRYSGATAGRAYAEVDVGEVAIVLSPNHTGRGRPVALVDRGRFWTPLGAVPIAEDVAARVASEVPHVEVDRAAHAREHGVELHLPFLQARRPDVALVPLVVARDDLEACRRMGEALARVVASTTRSVLLVASTDMSHFLSAQEAARLDRMALDRVVDLDPAGLYETVHRHEISMCGFLATTIVLYAALALGASRAQTSLVDYRSSGDVTGDDSRVVGYAGVVVR